MNNNKEIESILIGMDKRIESLSDGINQKIESLSNKIDERFEKIDERFEKIDERFDSVEGRLTNIELTLENEIRPNIQILAEGHSILLRKIDDLTKVRDEHDYTKIRLDVLESRVNRLEEKIS